MNNWTPFLDAKVESLDNSDSVDENIIKQHENRIKSQEEKLDELIDQAKNYIEQTANTLEAAQATATGVSVKEAQEQFKNAQTPFNWKMAIWGTLSAAGIISFFVVAMYFYDAQVPDEWQWIYKGTIRISILAAIGSIIAFFFKMLRAHMYMSEKNQHRQRVANSIGAFVGSATTSEQRDMILSQLVESVVQFGNSGLLHREDDNIYRPKMTIDSIMRTLSTKSSKE